MNEQEQHHLRVAANFPAGSTEHLVALYHDHLEDGLGEVPDPIRAHVEVLTRGMYESYGAYIERIRTSGDPTAIAVKIADAEDNFARSCGKYGGLLSAPKRLRYSSVIRELTAPSERENA